MIEADDLGNRRRGDAEPGLGLQAWTGHPETGFVRIGRPESGWIRMSRATRPEVVVIRVLEIGQEYLR